MIEARISVVQKLLEDSVWSKTPLLTVMCGRLQDGLRAMQANARPAEMGDCCLVYVSLYHQQGRSIAVWQDVLKQIKYAVQCRPIYLSAQEARKGLRECEAVVALKVDRVDIVQSEREFFLKPGCISEASINGFYWSNRDFVYDGKLLLEGC